MTAASLLARIGPAPEPHLPTHGAVAEWRTATPDDIDAMHSVFVAADAVDHPTWITPREEIADTFDLTHIDHSRDSVIALDADGRAVAFGSAFLHPSRAGELTVHVSGAVVPTLRRQGIGAEVIAWTHARALQQLAEAATTATAGEWKMSIKAYAEESTPDVAAIVRPFGMVVERWFTTMVRDMDGVGPSVEARGDVRIVPYETSLADKVLTARNDAFRDHWGSLPTSSESWQKFVGGEFLRPDLSRLVIDDAGDVAALCLASVNEDDWAALGASHAYIDLIGVVRAHRRRGLAPLVIAASLEAIAAAGLKKTVLDVDTASPTGANSLYEGLGFSATERSMALVQHL